MNKSNNDNSNVERLETSHTSSLQKYLEKIWYENAKGRWILLPLTGLYCAISTLKRWKDTRKQAPVKCPIIIVGNITVGGTGKTPLTIYTVKLLQEKGFKPAIITRGYGGQASSWPQLVTAESDASLVGDEAVLMARRTGVPVYAGSNRMSAISSLLKNHEIDVIVSDDGLQHFKMPRDIRIVVIDGKRRLGNGYCLPAGPLRERKNRLNNCDLIVLNGASKEPVPASWLTMSLQGDVLINIKTAEEKSLKEFSDQRVNAVTGIGHPKRFYQTLEYAGLILNRHDFPDHYDFKSEDFVFGANNDNNLMIIMTEKDAVKCKVFAKDNFWYLPVSAQLDERFDKMLLERISPLIKN